MSTSRWSFSCKVCGPRSTMDLHAARHAPFSVLPVFQIRLTRGKREERRGGHFGVHGIAYPVLLVRMKGLEPSLPRGNWNLNPARLPISPHPHALLELYRARDGLRGGFAVLAKSQSLGKTKWV